MRRWVKVLGGVALVVAALGLWKREEVTRLMAVNSLFAPDKIVQNFSQMDRLFLTRPLSRGDGPVSPLPNGPEAALPPEVADWVAARNVTALVVLKDGALVHESYYLGTGPEDLRISWSVAKSFLSALFGVVLAEGKIASLDDPVTRYAPALVGSAYDGASIHDVLTMSSGVGFNEDYLDFWSDINRMGRVLALGGSMDGFAADMKERAAEPGVRMHYVSIDTHVLGMVIRGATGEDIPELLDRHILSPMGMEAAPYYLTDGEGVSFVLGGMNVTTRDYARFGQMMLQGGQWQGRQIVPRDWAMQSTVPQAKDGSGYGYQWWIADGAGPGEFNAQGIYGQYIWIDRSRNVVIAVNAADLGFEDAGVSEGNMALFRKIAAAVSD
ncbi:MAG: 6-aminohexanoate hydrolase [Rhodobacteraceae bacterium PARR1]|nr:MAG: 6-aminohexanoate hydrolase [Rhodobacteraceae bacterium PARR1]